LVELLAFRISLRDEAEGLRVKHLELKHQLALLSSKMADAKPVESDRSQTPRKLEQLNSSAVMDPLNQPVSDLSATVRFYTKRSYDRELTSRSAFFEKWGFTAQLQLFYTNLDHNYPAVLFCKGYNRHANNTRAEHTYVLQLNWSDHDRETLAGIAGLSPSVSRFYQSVDGLKLRLEFLPYRAEVTTGVVDLVINGFLHKHFAVVGHTNQPMSAESIPGNVITILDAIESPAPTAPAHPMAFWEPEEKARRLEDYWMKNEREAADRHRRQR
jgi:hypothetical protein